MLDGPSVYAEDESGTTFLTPERRLGEMKKDLEEILTLVRNPTQERYLQNVNEKLSQIIAHYKATSDCFNAKQRAFFDIGNKLNSNNVVEVVNFALLALAGFDIKDKKDLISANEFYDENITSIIKLIDIFNSKPSIECLFEILKKTSLSIMADFSVEETQPYIQQVSFCRSFHAILLQHLEAILTNNPQLISNDTFKIFMRGMLRTIIELYTLRKPQEDFGYN